MWKWTFLLSIMLVSKFQGSSMRSFGENEFIVLYDVPIYSKVIDLFSWDDLNGIEVSPESVLHITRHLSALDADAQKKILGLPINDMGMSHIVDSNFQVENSHIVVSGQGNARIHTNQSLNATISGMGSCTYSGAPPQIQRQISGMGHIKPA